MRKAIFAAAVALISAWALKPEPVLSHAVVNTTVNYDRDISRIVRKRCLSCHSENNLGIPLTTYEETRPWSASLKEEVLRRHMPPWRALRGYGTFANDAGLTSKEQAFLLAWIDGKGPKGTEHIVANVDQFKSAAEERLKLDPAWQLGKPDLLKVLTPTTVAPGEGDIVRRVEIDLGLRSERTIRALEFKPGDRRVVRAVTFTVRDSGQWLGSWTPWYPTMALPADMGIQVPAGARVVAEIHYRSTDVPVDERGSLALYFTSKAVIASPRSLVIDAAPAAADAKSAPGSTKFGGSVRLASETTLLAINPEVTASTRSFSLSARQPNGAVRVLLLVRDALPEWPTPYVFTDPVRLPRGTELILVQQLASGDGAGAPDRVRMTLSVVAAPTVDTH